MTSEDDSEPKPLEDATGYVPWKPPSPAQLQGLLQGFEVLELIGSGGMGAVYRARQISLDRMVAIKLLPPAVSDSNADYSERFRHEARMMARLAHPGIIAVFDFGESSDGQLYFVMEYVKGIDVAHMLLQQGKLQPLQPLHALSIAAHVCDTLRYAHEQGIIHFDIKPANVMVDIEGRVKVADFGLASLAAQDTSHDDSTTMGTPDYVAPEALVIGVKVDHRADLYSLGVMLYEMLTGKVPHQPVVPPSAAVPGLDKRFDAVVKHALESDPNVRYQSASIFRKDLDQILSVPVATPVQAKSGPVRHLRPNSNRAAAAVARATTSAGRTQQKNDTPWGLIVFVFIAIAAGAFYFLKDHKSSQKHEDIIEAPVVRREPDRIKKTKNGTDTTRKLREMNEMFNTDMAREVTKPHAEAVANLDSKYAAALGREIAKVEDSRSEYGLAHLRKEKERAETRRPVPEHDAEDLPSSLKKLRETYRTSLSKMVADRNHAAERICEKQARLLSSLHDDLVRSGKNDEAAEVNAKLKEIKQMHFSNGGDSP